MTDIYLVDTDQTFLTTAQSVVGGSGASSKVFASGEALLSDISEAPPQLVVISAELSDTSGFSVCNKIKKNKQLKKIPVIIVSAESTDADFEAHQGFKTKAQRYFHKPVDFATLNEAVGELLPELNAVPPERAPVDATQVQAVPASLADLDSGHLDMQTGQLSDLELRSTPQVQAEATVAVASALHDPLLAAPNDVTDDASELGGLDLSDIDLSALKEIDEADTHMLASLSDEAPALEPKPPQSEALSLNATLSQPAPNQMENDIPRLATVSEPTAMVNSSEGAALQAEAAELRAQVRSLEAQLSSMQNSLASGEGQAVGDAGKDREMLALRKQLQEKDKEILRVKDALVEKDEKIIEHVEQLNLAIQNEATYKSQLASFEATKTSLQNDLTNALNMNEQLKAQVVQLQSQSASQLEALQTKLKDVEGRNTVLTSRVKTIESRISTSLDILQKSDEDRLNAVKAIGDALSSLNA